MTEQQKRQPNADLYPLSFEEVLLLAKTHLRVIAQFTTLKVSSDEIALQRCLDELLWRQRGRR